MLCAKERAELLTAVGFTEQQAASFNDVLFSSGGALAEAGIPADLLAALNDWHTATWYTVEDQDDYQVHSVGVKPKDTLADIIFACCFARFSQATYTCPPTRGVGCHYHHCPPGPSFHASPLFLSKCAWCLTGLPCCFPLSPTWHSRCFPELPDLISPAFFDLPLLPPAFHDDFVIPIAADSPTLLLQNLVRVADIVHNVAQQHAMQLQFCRGQQRRLSSIYEEEARRQLLKPWQLASPVTSRTALRRSHLHGGSTCESSQTIPMWARLQQ